MRYLSTLYFSFTFSGLFVLRRLHEMVWGLMSSDIGLTYLGQKASLPSAGLNTERHSPHKTTVAYSNCLMQSCDLYLPHHQVYPLLVMSFVSAPSSGLSVIGHVTCICPIKFIRYWSRHFYQPHHQVYQLLVMTLVSAPSSTLSVTGHDTCICHIINFILFWS